MTATWEELDLFVGQRTFAVETGQLGAGGVRRCRIRLAATRQIGCVDAAVAAQRGQ